MVRVQRVQHINALVIIDTDATPTVAGWTIRARRSTTASSQPIAAMVAMWLLWCLVLCAWAHHAAGMWPEATATSAALTAATRRDAQQCTAFLQRHMPARDRDIMTQERMHRDCRLALQVGRAVQRAQGTPSRPDRS